MSDSHIKKSDVVKSVFYAVVMSAWASIVCGNGHGFTELLIRASKCFFSNLFDWHYLWRGIKVFFKLILAHDVALMSLGVFAFLTLYFHDEWKYADSTKNDGYPEEQLAIQCASWSFFLFQVCLMDSSIMASAICGAAGTTLITLGIICSLKRKSIKCRFVWENCSWAVALVVFASGKNSCTWLLLLPMVFVICRPIPIVGRLGMPKLRTSNQCIEKGGDKNE